MFYILVVTKIGKYTVRVLCFGEVRLLPYTILQFAYGIGPSSLRCIQRIASAIRSLGVAPVIHLRVFRSPCDAQIYDVRLSSTKFGIAVPAVPKVL
eukprot:SAG11_NODE_5754_length_1471_cov_1.752915_1_plen_96_part_00